MTKMSDYPSGLFCWVDLVAHDLEAAKRWYGELFGWQANDQDTQGGPPYVRFTKDGRTVAGAGQMSDEMKQAGVPPMWNDYVSVADAAATEAKARELGATISVPTMKVMDVGRLCFFSDPEGVNIAVWEPQEHHGAQLVNEPGSFAWNERVTRDVEAIKRFYGQLFGWTFEAQPMPDVVYHTIKLGQRDNGGIMPMIGSQWEGIPPHWMTYFAVEDANAAAARVDETGGKVLVPPTDIPQVGRFAVVSDPQGAMFTVIKLDQPRD